MSHSFFNTKTRTQGWALTELIVVTSILLILATIVITNNRAFDTRLKLSNFAHEIAFVFKTAQSAAVNVAVGEDDGNFQFGTGFGVAIEEDMNQIIYFRDADLDLAYTGGVDAILNTYTPSSQFAITSVCIAGADGDAYCFGRGEPRSSLSATYVRPHLQGTMAYDNGSCTDEITSMQITIESLATDDVRYVIVSSSGMIYTAGEPELSETNQC